MTKIVDADNNTTVVFSSFGGCDSSRLARPLSMQLYAFIMSRVSPISINSCIATERILITSVYSIHIPVTCDNYNRVS